MHDLTEQVAAIFDNVRVVLPLFDDEVRGVEALRMVAAHAFPGSSNLMPAARFTT